MGRRQLEDKAQDEEDHDHENVYAEYSHGDRYFRRYLRRVCRKNRDQGSDDENNRGIWELGMWWEYQGVRIKKEILFMIRKKRKDGDGFSRSEVEEIGPQIEEACLVSYYSNKMQHILVECKGRKFYVEINSIGDVRVPLAASPRLHEGGVKLFIRTEDGYDIANFYPMRDWKREDFKDSRRGTYVFND